MPTEKLIKTPEALRELWEKYKTHIKANPILVHDFVGKDAHSVHREKQRPFTMAGFEVYCYDAIGCVNQYFDNADGRYEAYITICSHIRKEIRNNQIDGGMAGIFNPSITQRLNGLTDKQEIKTDQPSEIKVTIVKGNRKKK
jgi:hypothetical protein